MLLSAAGISKLAQLAMQLIVSEAVSMLTISEAQYKNILLPFFRVFSSTSLT